MSSMSKSHLEEKVEKVNPYRDNQMMEQNVCFDDNCGLYDEETLEDEEFIETTDLNSSLVPSYTPPTDSDLPWSSSSLPYYTLQAQVKNDDFFSSLLFEKVTC